MSMYIQKRRKKAGIVFRCSDYDKLKWEAIAASEDKTLSKWITERLNSSRDRLFVSKETIELSFELGQAVELIKSGKTADAIAYINQLRLRMMEIEDVGESR